MTSFFMSMVYLIIGIAISVLLIIVGLILLVRGFLKRYLAEYRGTNTPRNFMIAGVVMISLPVMAFIVISLLSITSSVKTIYARSHYECVPDIWRNVSVAQSQAESDILKALLKSADSGDADAFAKNFTPELQKSRGFDKAVKEFFKSYPVGLSECERNDQSGGDSGENESEPGVRTDNLSFSCDLNGNRYFLYVEYCYRNAHEPNKVGVTMFLVMNLEAAAVYERSGEEQPDDTYLICNMKSSHEVNARLIGGRPYVWTPTDVPLLRADELRYLLKETGRLDDPVLQNRLGEPNIGIKHDDSTEYGYFYQLANQNGEPRYAYFQTDSEYGNILYALLCTPYEVDYDNPLFMHENYN